MRILWLTPLFPYPLFSGGQVRAYNLIKNLSRNHQITLFSFIRPNRKQGPLKALKKLCPRIKTFPGRRIWSLRNILLASLTRLPFTVTHFYGDPAVRRALKEEISRRKYDLVHFESFYTSPYLDCVSLLPVVMGNENIEYLLYQRYIEQKRIPLKWLLTFDVWKMRLYEQNVWRKADLNLAVSRVDAKKIEKITNKKCVVVPNGVDIRYFSKLKPSWSTKLDGRPIVLFVGDFRYFANQDALNFLLKEIWPLVKIKVPRTVLWLVGKNSNLQVKNLASKSVIVDNQVQDIRQAYNSADVFIVPMRIGSGTNIKVLEAMACRLPVVSTSIGAEGIEVKEDREIVIRDDPKELAVEVIRLLKNNTRRRKLGEAGYKVVEKLYDWPKITKRLEKAYWELVCYEERN